MDVIEPNAAPQDSIESTLVLGQSLPKQPLFTPIEATHLSEFRCLGYYPSDKDFLARHLIPSGDLLSCGEVAEWPKATVC